MPRVPSNVVAMPQRPQAAPMPQVDPTYLAMAMAAMHGEGKLAPKPKES